MLGPLLVPPSNLNDEYVPSPEVLACLPDARNENPPGEQVESLIPGPVLRAAKTSDIRILRGLLQHGFPPTNYIVGPLNNPWESSLISAVLAGPDFDEHVKMLVDHGAKPNGFPTACYRVASTRFIRGRSPEDTWTAGCYLKDRFRAMADVRPSLLAADPTADLTEAELQKRRKSRSRFWAEVDFPRTDYPINNPTSSLSAAIEVANTRIYAYLAANGADEDAWTDSQKYHLLADDLPPSYFAIESPLFIAIMTENRDALQFLLERRHKPDIFPMVLATRCLNPIMTTIAKPNPWLDGFDLLAPHADLSLLTPIFRCHLLHFATATHDLSLIKHVVSALGGPAAVRCVPPTSLGHTLLHVASLPIDESVVNMHSRQIYLSIHEFRTTDERWEPMRLVVTPTPTRASIRGGGFARGQSSRTRGGSWMRRFRPTSFRDLSLKEHEAQAAVLIYLMDSGAVLPERLAEKDFHGNTVLHYLVAVRNPNYEILEALRSRVAYENGDSHMSEPAGVRLWSGIENIHGFTAEDLDTHGRATRAEIDDRELAPFWSDD
jgi:hypothetical protein